MTTPPQLPLAAASARLRGKPGRPRKTPPVPAETGDGGHNAGTPPPRTRVNTGAERGALAYKAMAPRLLDLHATPTYLGVSEWTARDLETAGVLRRVRIPLPHGGELRKLLFDVRDLDELIGRWKDAPP